MGRREETPETRRESESKRPAMMMTHWKHKSEPLEGWIGQEEHAIGKSIKSWHGFIDLSNKGFNLGQ